MSVTVELDDRFPRIIKAAIANLQYCAEGYNRLYTPDEVPSIDDLDVTGSVHEIVDSAVPTGSRDIETIMFLHGKEIWKVCDDIADCISSEPSLRTTIEAWHSCAIYCYIREKLHEWYQENAEEIYKKEKISAKDD